jgi:PAS domain S-box-containing protein
MKNERNGLYIFLSLIGVVFGIALYSLLHTLKLTEQKSHIFLFVWIFIILLLPVIAITYVLYAEKKKRTYLIQQINTFLHGRHSDNIHDCDGIINEVSEKFNSLRESCTVMSEEIQRQKTFIEQYFTTMFNGLLVHNKMQIINANNAITDMTGFTREEILSLSLEKVILPHESLMGRNGSHTPVLHYRSTCFARDGSKFPVDIQMTRMQSGEDNVQISIIRDLREKQEIEQQLQSERARRIKAMFDGQEMERKRLAKEIHDGLGQSLIAIRLLLEGKIAVSSGINTDALEKIRQLIDNTISEARLMSNNLMPSVLHEFGFVTALRQLCDHVRQSTRIKVNFEVDCSRFVLNTVQTVYLFRIAQEAVNNILKHAKAGEMSVLVNQSDSQLELLISDNGQGIKKEKAENVSGNGLYNIRERVQLLQGEFQLTSSPGQGTEIKIIIPNWRLVTYE